MEGQTFTDMDDVKEGDLGSVTEDPGQDLLLEILDYSQIPMTISGVIANVGTFVILLINGQVSLSWKFILIWKRSKLLVFLFTLMFCELELLVYCLGNSGINYSFPLIFRHFPLLFVYY